MTRSLTGVGIPWWAPRRAITPLRASHSIRRPASRSNSIDVPRSGGSSTIRPMISSTVSGPTCAPSARPTATHSSARRRASASGAGSRNTSARRPVRTIGAAVALKHSLRHASVWKSATRSTRACSPSSAASAAPSGVSGTLTRARSRWRTRPGATVSAGHHTIAGSTVAGPASGATRASCSTPFCSTATTVSAPHNRSSQRTVPAVWCVLTASRTQGMCSAADGSARTAPASAWSPAPPGSSTTGAGPGRRPHSATCARRARRRRRRSPRSRRGRRRRRRSSGNRSPRNPKRDCPA